ncbi:MAG TPA: FAD-dependent oxidoreductase, partial [Candidatus Limnocylindrales bacterium]
MTPGARSPRTRVLIVGGGFAGVACGRALAKQPGIEVLLVDKNDYHQFQPLLYQVATSMLAAGDIAYPLRRIGAEYHDFAVKRGEVVAVDPVARVVTTSTGETYAGDYLVLAAGSQPNFFGVPGAEHAFPLYSLDDADRLRARIIEAFEEVDRVPDLADLGAINFIVVGGGPTGVEVAGALSEMINTTIVHEFPAIAPRAKVVLVDHGHALLAMFADKGHAYAAQVLGQDGVELRLGTGVTEVGPGHVTLTDGSTLPTRCVIWGGGLQAAAVAAAAGSAGLPTGRGGRVDVQPDFTIEGFPAVLAIGDVAN